MEYGAREGVTNPKAYLTKGQDRPERSQKRRHHARDCDDTAMRSAYNKQGQGVTYSNVLEGFMFRGRYRPLAHYRIPQRGLPSPASRTLNIRAAPLLLLVLHLDSSPTLKTFQTQYNSLMVAEVKLSSVFSPKIIASFQSLIP